MNQLISNFKIDRTLIRVFLGFSFLSGLGWICDFVTFILLVKAADTPPYAANFISSYVGITFVYFTSLKSLFKKRDDKRGLYLLIYWVYQFFSISLYSVILNYIAVLVSGLAAALVITQNSGIVAKIIVTPVNLLTNFIFMKALTYFMKDETETNV